MDKRHLKQIKDKDRLVWMCVTCKKYVVGGRYDKPETCPCSHPNYVVAGEFIVTKSERE